MLWKLDMKVCPEKPGFWRIFSPLDSLMSNRRVSASWGFSHCWEFPDVSFWCPRPGGFQMVELTLQSIHPPAETAAASHPTSGCLPPHNWQKHSARGSLRAYICHSRSSSSHAQFAPVHFKINYFQEKAFEYFEAEWKDNLYLGYDSEQQRQSGAEPTQAGLPLAVQSDLSFFSWRTERIEKLETLERKGSVFLLASEWFLLKCLLRDTYVQRGSKHRGSASSGVRGIFGHTIYTHLRTLPDWRHPTGRRRRVAHHSRWKGKELEGCRAPLHPEGKMQMAGAAPFRFRSCQDEN